MGDPELTFDGIPYKVTLNRIEKDECSDSSNRNFSDEYAADLDYYFRMVEKNNYNKLVS